MHTYKKKNEEGGIDSLVRQDAWNQDEDLLLAEVVLRHIREGSTQLSAFEEVGDSLSRTPAACGFRWNSSIRKQYESAIQLAKKQRKQVKKNTLAEKSDRVNGEPHIAVSSVTETEEPVVQVVDEIVKFLLKRTEEIKKLDHVNRKGVSEERFQNLIEENKLLQNELTHLKEEHELVKNDYLLMINVVERATKRNQNHLSVK